MTRVLTVDDSRAIRNIVQKQLVDAGIDVDEAEDGEQGLAALEECEYDLVVLDVTMPVMDGPTMLQKMREAGRKTPVLMLTSEAKRSIIAGCMKLGIDDYILKPFKPEELRSKVMKALKREGGEVPAAPAARAEAPVAAPREVALAAAAGDSAPRSFVDVLVVDDMENVHRKLRSMVPPAISLLGVASANAALAAARDKVCRVVLVDTDIPDVNSVALLHQMRALQPHAAFLAMPLRSAPDGEKRAREDGFEGTVAKPFQAENVEDFLLKYFDNQDTLTAQDNVLSVGQFTGKEERLERFFSRVVDLSRGALEKVAAACFDDAILDLTKAPISPERTPRAVLEIEKQARSLSLSLRLAGPPELAKLLTAFTDTAAIPLFPDVTSARSAA